VGGQGDQTEDALAIRKASNYHPCPTGAPVCGAIYWRSRNSRNKAGGPRYVRTASQIIIVMSLDICIKQPQEVP
jgi:hypothetical protein